MRRVTAPGPIAGWADFGELTLPRSGGVPPLGASRSPVALFGRLPGRVQLPLAPLIKERAPAVWTGAVGPGIAPRRC